MAAAHLAYWAKTAPEGWHPLACHGLDVAAVAAELLHRHTPWRAALAAATGRPAAALAEDVPALFALHDLGKASRHFQGRNARMAQLLGHPAGAGGRAHHHSELGYGLWHHVVTPDGPPALAATSPEAQLWVAALMGHHGVPIDQFHAYRAPPGLAAAAAGGAAKLRRNDLGTGQDRAAALALASDLAALLAPDRSLLPVGDGRATWLVNGFLTLCDWLGSNTAWFPVLMPADAPAPQDLDLAAYWRDRALPAARAAVTDSGAVPAAPPPAAEPAALLRTATGSPAPTPSPMQAAAAELPLASGPQLIFLQDLTGGGKTEAALLLAQRLIAECGHHGLYLALPTMATAEAMFGRLATAYRSLFGPHSQPSLNLAHGQRGLSESFRRLVLGAESAGGPPMAGDAEAAGSAATASAWAAESLKKAFFTDVGVGTIDQALMAVLPIKHQSLRLLGLAGKVLVVDEAHAYDSYTSQLLAALLNGHARHGGSAIVLSATLTAQNQADLAVAFSAGAELPEPGAATGAPASAYPQLAQLSAQGYRRRALDPGAAPYRLATPQVGDPWTALESALAHAQAGRAVCWVRNTVPDARWAYAQLAAAIDERGLTLGLRLVHARFTHSDRQRLESQLAADFGKDSGPESRAGQIVVATQVVEQSLDVDFDAMIADLAPLDLMIQRAGRQGRHSRTPDGTRLADGAGDKRPLGRQLGWVGPAATEDADATWYTNVLPRAAWVYRHPGILWLTARELAAGELDIPETLQSALERVYGAASADTLPSGLVDASHEVEGAALAQADIAAGRSLSFDRSYPEEEAFADDTDIPVTRLGGPQITLYLARHDPEDGLVAFHGGRTSLAWGQSRVAVPASGSWQAAGEAAQVTSYMTHYVDPAAARLLAHGVLVVLRPDEGCWRGEIADERGRLRPVAYDSTTGAQVQST